MQNTVVRKPGTPDLWRREAALQPAAATGGAGGLFSGAAQLWPAGQLPLLMKEGPPLRCAYRSPVRRETGKKKQNLAQEKKSNRVSGDGTPLHAQACRTGTSPCVHAPSI